MGDKVWWVDWKSGGLRTATIDPMEAGFAHGRNLKLAEVANQLRQTEICKQAGGRMTKVRGARDGKTVEMEHTDLGMTGATGGAACEIKIDGERHHIDVPHRLSGTASVRMAWEMGYLVQIGFDPMSLETHDGYEWVPVFPNTLPLPPPPQWKLYLWRRDREGQDGPYFYNNFSDIVKSMQSFEPKAVIKVQIEAPRP
jgi:hypothetical protein